MAQLLGRYTLDQCRDALVIFWRNRPDDYLKPGHPPTSSDAEPLSRRPADTASKSAIPAIPRLRLSPTTNQATPARVQAQVMADLQLGNGRWAKLADPAEVYRMKVRPRRRRRVPR